MFILLDSKLYTYYTDKLTWYDANMYCQKKGLELATPKNEKEIAKMSRLSLSYSYYWIGGRVRFPYEGGKGMLTIEKNVFQYILCHLSEAKNIYEFEHSVCHTSIRD